MLLLQDAFRSEPPTSDTVGNPAPQRWRQMLHASLTRADQPSSSNVRVR